MTKQLPSKAAEAFAARLKMTRQTQYQFAKDFAEDIKEEAETYRMYERGQREPNLDKLAKIAMVLNVSLDYLILGHLPALHSINRKNAKNNRLIADK